MGVEWAYSMKAWAARPRAAATTCMPRSVALWPT